MGHIYRTDEATADLLDLIIYAIERLGTARAKALSNEIERKLRLLSNQPHMGRPRDEYRVGLRSFPVAQYVIFYLPMADGITLVRVLHGRRDLDTVFNDDAPGNKDE